MSSVYLLTLAARDANGDPVTLRVSRGGYHADGENWLPRLKRPVLFAGRARLPWLRQVNDSRGDAELDNADGRLDYLVDYALDGGALTIQTWNGSTLSTVLEGTVTRTEVLRNSIRLILRDPAEYLREDHPQDVYLGDGSALEGTADIAGRPKPQVLGSVSNATPVEVDYGLQIYQVSSLADCSVSAARDRGIALTQGADYASQAELLDPTLTPASGSFRSWQGFLRLGDTAQALTVDAEQASSAARDVLEHIVLSAGGQLAATTPTLSQSIGIYLDGPRSSESMIDEIAASVGGYWHTNAAGDVAIAVLAVGTPVDEIPPHRIIEIERTKGGASSNGLPVHQVRVRADRVDTVQTDVAANALTPARWAAKYRAFRASDTATKARHPLSQELTVDTALRGSGQALANSLLALLSPRRDTTRVTTRLDLFGHRRIGDTLTIRHPRFGYANGRDMIVLGRSPDAERGAVTFEMWG